MCRFQLVSSYKADRHTDCLWKPKVLHTIKKTAEITHWYPLTAFRISADPIPQFERPRPEFRRNERHLDAIVFSRKRRKNHRHVLKIFLYTSYSTTRFARIGGRFRPLIRMSAFAFIMKFSRVSPKRSRQRVTMLVILHADMQRHVSRKNVDFFPPIWKHVSLFTVSNLVPGLRL